ncbi:MAG: hypothetical protein CMI00_09855 [Oceanospirillaceae bacterium]|nr:hypothetical protein [Oceanospirillaceae bacterium]
MHFRQRTNPPARQRPGSGNTIWNMAPTLAMCSTRLTWPMQQNLRPGKPMTTTPGAPTNNRAGRNNMKLKNVLLSLLLLSVFSSAEVLAATQSWQDLPEETRILLADMQAQWDDLDADERQALLTRAEQFSQLSEDEQAALLARYERWSALPAEERAALQQKYQAFRALPEEQRQTIIRKYQWFRSLPEEKQQELRNGWKNLTRQEQDQLRLQFRNSDAEQRQRLRSQMIQKKNR